MLKLQMPKKVGFSYPLLLLIIFFSNSCKKDDLKILTTKDKITDAKNWYLEQTKNSLNFLSTNKGDSILIENEPQWDKVKTILTEDKTLVMSMPIKTNLYDITGKEGELNLLIRYADDGIKEYKLVNSFKENIADSTQLTPLKLYKFAYPGSGKEPVNKARVLNLVNNKITTSKKMSLNGSRKISLGKASDKLKMAAECTHHFWVERHWMDGEIVSEEWTYLFSSGCGSGGGAPEEESPTPGEGGPDPSPNSSYTIDIDTSILNNPKASCVLMKLLGVPQFNHLVAAFKNKGFDLKFQVKTTLQHTGSRGESLHSTINPQLFEINLRRSFVNSASPIHVAKTLLHEGFHVNLMQKAYEIFGSSEINSNWVKKPENMELNELIDIIENKVAGTSLEEVTHEYMANNITTMRDALWQFAQDNDANFPNYDGFDILALAWEGLTGTKYYIDNVKNEQIYYIPNTTVHMQADSLFSLKLNNLNNDSQVNCP